jgi:hypothetical protein
MQHAKSCYANLIFPFFFSFQDEDINEIIENSVSPTIVMSGDNLFDIHLFYIVAEESMLCDASNETKLLDVVVLLLCSYFVFNYDYVIQKNVLFFFKRRWEMIQLKYL